MKYLHHSRKCSIIFTFGLLLISLILLSALWIRAQQRQDTMNRQLIEALYHLEFQRAQKLVEAGADPNTHVKPMPTPTPLELLGQLLHRSLPMNTSGTAFMVACWPNRLPEYQSDGSKPLPWILVHNSQLTQLVQAMLAHGANINAIDAESGETALMLVSYFGITDRMSLLLESGASVDLQNNLGDTALQRAVEGIQPGAVTLLLNYHANPNLKNRLGHTPLWYLLKMQTMGLPDADRLRIKQIIRLLMQAGAGRPEGS